MQQGDADEARFFARNFTGCRNLPDTRQGGDVSEDRHLASIVLFYFLGS